MQTKKERGTTFFLTCVIYADESFFTDRLFSWNQHGHPSVTAGPSSKQTAYLKHLGYVAFVVQVALVLMGVLGGLSNF